MVKLNKICISFYIQSSLSKNPESSNLAPIERVTFAYSNEINVIINGKTKQNMHIFLCTV